MHVILTIPGSIIVTLGLLLATSVHAFDLGNMMSPSRWIGSGGDDHYYDNYYGGRGYGYGYPGDSIPGYGYGGLPVYGGLPGYGHGGLLDHDFGGIPGYGGMPGLSGDPLYGLGGLPGYDAVPGYGAPGYGAPGYGYPAAPGHERTESPEAAEIKRLKERIRKLEEATKQTQSVWSYPPAKPAATAPWGEQPGFPQSTAPWGEQPGYPAATTPWSTQQ